MVHGRTVGFDDGTNPDSLMPHCNKIEEEEEEKYCSFSLINVNPYQSCSETTRFILFQEPSQLNLNITLYSFTSKSRSN
ncbi:hypothetical protein FRX31_010053 [Thalictrum thalictroides]|uniref:Uncharacterized protein n=1 Tax=Thalictrum thalictroides TaxID=46969 RepID=A0A7J6WSK4_THATH|nr:hypothetical protein FRX31_010053 [Thalictrum thalictroides]